MMLYQINMTLFAILRLQRVAFAVWRGRSGFRKTRQLNVTSSNLSSVNCENVVVGTINKEPIVK